MITTIWMALVYKPIYNAFFFLLWAVPGHNVGLAVIALTLVVRFAIYPLSAKAIRAQKAMKRLEPKMKAVKEKHKDDRQAQANAMMELYKEEGVSPMGGCLPLLIQIPIISTLFFILKGFMSANPAYIYPFVPQVAAPSILFLGMNLAGKSLLLALLVGLSQYVTTKLSIGKIEKKVRKEGEDASFADDFQSSMQTNMLYFLPILLTFTAYKLTAAVALYWVTTNLFTIGQELVVRRQLAKKA